MKKLLCVAVALAMVFGFAMTSAADVQVTLTSPTITKAPGSCEKAGAVTFAFPAGSVLNDGDWWYMDLPSGATLCKSVDYVIGGQVAAGPAADSYAFVDTLDPTEIVGGANYAFIGNGGALALGGAGPVNLIDSGGGAAAVVVGNLSIRVIGQSGSRRVTLYVADDVDGVTGNSLTVGADTVLQVKILDGSPHIATGTAANANTRILLDRDGVAFATANIANQNDTGTWRAYGQTTADALEAPSADEEVDTVTYSIPHVENTLCVNAETAVGNLHVSFASKNDEFTFSGDSQIAHVGGGTTITLEVCTGKTGSTDEIIYGLQDACNFDYESGTGYCSGHSTSSAIYMHAGGGTFGEIDDLYDMEIEVLTDGVYFSGPPSVRGILGSETVCDDAGTLVAAAWTFCSGSNCDPADVSYPTTSECTVDSDERIDRIYTEGGDIDAIHNYTDMVFNYDEFVYDTAVASVGDEVDLLVTLSKYPCGEIWSGNITIGTFVDTCGSGGGTTTLLFPWLPGSSFVGWWGGYVITNGSATAGTATLTATDENGNSATYETDSIDGYGFFNASFLTTSSWTQAAGNSANFDGGQSYIVVVSCNFSRGAGFAMLGNSREGVGYTAETTGW